MSENAPNREVQNENQSLLRVCKTEHLGGAIFVDSIETSGIVVTACTGLDSAGVIVKECKGNLSGPVVAVIPDEFDAKGAHRGAVMEK